MERKIKITIDPLGNASFDAIGFQGQGCKDATKVMEQALANGDGDMTMETKPSWHETEDQTHVNEVGQGW